jgi:protein-serine/threonine kinase
MATSQPAPLTAQHNMLTSTEDLTKFPSESLHSFSYSQPRSPAAILESRQSILRKSIDYMKDKLHGVGSITPWADQDFTVSPVDTTLSKDDDVLQTLKRANLIPDYWDETSLPLATAPIGIVENPFDNFETEPLTIRRKKRTPTDVSGFKLQAKLFDAVTKPYSLNGPVPPDPSMSPVGRRLSLALLSSQIAGPTSVPGVVPVHTTTRFAPTMQAIFSTAAESPWKILNANDLACLEFGISEQDIKRGVSILECFEAGRQEWIRERLQGRTNSDAGASEETESTKHGTPDEDRQISKEEPKERVLLCGDVVTMRKVRTKDRNKTATMAASLWVKEKVLS